MRWYAVGSSPDCGASTAMIGAFAFLDTSKPTDPLASRWREIAPFKCFLPSSTG
jgi:hypothetical protein